MDLSCWSEGSQCTLQSSTVSFLDKLNKSKWNGIAHAKPIWRDICLSVTTSQGNSEVTEVNDWVDYSVNHINCVLDYLFVELFCSHVFIGD